MGIHADDLIHQEIMASIKADDYNMGDYFFTAPPIPKVYWVTRGTNGCNGNKILIEDMETSHIINSINRCKRLKWRLEAIPYLEAELKWRLEAIPYLKAELKRRQKAKE